MSYSYHPNIQERRKGDCYKFNTSSVYSVSVRPGKTYLNQTANRDDLALQGETFVNQT